MVPTHTPNHRRARYPRASFKRPLAPYVLLVALVFVVAALAVGIAVLIRHGPGGTRSTDTLPAVAVSRRATINTEVGFGPKHVMTVSEHVELNRSVTSLRLTVPKWTTSVNGGEFHPSIKNFQVFLGDHPPLTVSRAVLPGDSLVVALPKSTRTFTLAYVASGAVRKSEPSSAHRALALVTLVTMRPAERITNTINVTSASVTNIGCFEPSGTAMTCGSETADGWTVTQGPSDQKTAIVAQLDLHS